MFKDTDIRCFRASFPCLNGKDKKNKHDSAGGDVEKEEPLGTVGGSENSHSHCENSVFIP